MDLREIPGFAYALVVGGMLVGAGLVAITAFQTSLGSNISTMTAANQMTYFAINNFTGAISNFAVQMGIVGTIGGVAVAVFLVIRAFGMSGKRS